MTLISGDTDFVTMSAFLLVPTSPVHWLNWTAAVTSTVYAGQDTKSK
jgi:hypothetical protein